MRRGLEEPRLLVCPTGMSDRCVYTIPHLDGQLVYLPLRPLAFLADRETAAYAVRSVVSDPSRDPRDRAPALLESVGFFDPDPAPPSGLSLSGRFEPTTCVLLLTTSCNLRCVYCYAAPSGESVQIDGALGKRAIDIVCDNARKLGQAAFQLGFHGGGEPTTAMRTLRLLVAHARAKPLSAHISLATNGFWSAPQREEILGLGISSFSVSLDGVESVQDLQRPTVGGQKTFQAIMATLGEMDRRRIPYGIRASVTDRSVSQLAESIDFLCRNTACPTFQLEPVFAHGRALQTGTHLCHHQAFIDAFLDAYDIAQFHGRHLYYSGARPWVRTSRFCTALDQALIVTADGDLTACYEVFGKKHVLAGDLLIGRFGPEGDPIVDHAVRRRLLERVEERRAACRDCFCYYTCAGDCLTKVLELGEDGHLRFGPRCQVNCAITKELLLRRVEEAGGVYRGASAQAGGAYRGASAQAGGAC